MAAVLRRPPFSFGWELSVRELEPGLRIDLHDLAALAVDGAVLVGGVGIGAFAIELQH